MTDNFYCYFCDTYHTNRECNKEKYMAQYLKEMIGHKMEHIAASNLDCPMCGKHSLFVLGNNQPSVDIICKGCGRIFEVKSKAMSTKKEIPKNLIFQHGSWSYYNKRIEQGLHLIVIIYNVDRKNKSLKIKEVYHVPNKMLKDINNSTVMSTTRQGQNNTLSYIYIKNKLNLKKMTLLNEVEISFNDEFNKLNNDYNLVI